MKPRVASMLICHILLDINIMQLLWHGAEWNMANIFLVSHILLLFHEALLHDKPLYYHSVLSWQPYQLVIL